MTQLVIVTFYDNFREEDTSHVELSTLDIDGSGVDITVVATAGTWSLEFWFQSEPGDETGLMAVGPFAWDVAKAMLEAAIEAAFIGAHPTWVCSVDKVAGVYQVRFGSGDLGDPPPNAYRDTNINLSGHFSTVWDEHPYTGVPLTPNPNCGATVNVEPQPTPIGQVSGGSQSGGSIPTRDHVTG